MLDTVGALIERSVGGSNGKAARNTHRGRATTSHIDELDSHAIAARTLDLEAASDEGRVRFVPVDALDKGVRHCGT